MCFFIRRKKTNLPTEALVRPDSADWLFEEYRKDRAWERYSWWIYEQFADENKAKKLREYNDAMNALVEEIFDKKEH
ncbi:MAG: hypothetical protein IJQ90_02085 [Alphaproteobacteria bacterium]|nr:hypothetical protein [Alphaproteobacteria bacterium]